VRDRRKGTIRPLRPPQAPTRELEPVVFWRSMRLREIGFSSQLSAADLAARTRILAPTEHVPRSC
jgi:hypothetical protein